METLKNIVAKMRAPLEFATGDGYDRLARVKNLERVETLLCVRLQEAIRHDFPEPQKGEIERICVLLLALFADYAPLPPEQKRERLAEANRHFGRLDELVSSARVMPASPSGSSVPGKVDDLSLSRPLPTLRGVGPRISSLLAKKNITTIEELLYFLPRCYEDRRTVCRISETVPGIKQTVLGTITSSSIRFYGRRRIFTVTVDDGHGQLVAKWFKGREAYLRGAFEQGKRVIFTGTVGGSPFEREMVHPDFEILDDHEDQLLHFKRIVPVYSETEGLHQKTLRRIIWQAIRDYADRLESPLPKEIVRKRRLMEISAAVRQAHYPTDDQDLDLYQEMRSDAQRSLIYDELFFFQLCMALRKKGELLEQGTSFRPGGELFKRWIEALPYELTSAQRRVIAEIERDMSSTVSMNRLLQGDVGSGKTVVAMAAMVIACENGYQCAMMAPTEILAEQHYRNLLPWCENIGLRLALLTGNIPAEAKNGLKERLLVGGIDIAIGTHAIIQEGIVFGKLGLAIIDEQHRFGVVQRAALRKTNPLPDLLLMTATPIPRTLAMTVYGDLDVSVIDELPPAKKPVRTKVFTEAQRARVYEIIRREVHKGNQAFIVYPLVAETGNLSLKDATQMAEHLRHDVFPDYGVGLVHGRMKRVEKDRVMAAFVGRKIQILVSTTVIEVGIDIPEASLMVIEHAERFGLSQLHQLRGRVGRSDIPSYCILLAQHGGSNEARKRLRIMEETSDGFRIAEEDLAIRGPGEFMGTRQSGLPDFRVANIIRDGRLLSEARDDAFAIVNEDPQLENPDHIGLRKTLLTRWGDRLDWAKTS